MSLARKTEIRREESDFELLEKYRWSARALSIRLPNLLELEIGGEERFSWISGLRMAQGGLWAMDAKSLKSLFEFACRLGDWPMVLDAGKFLGDELECHEALDLIEACARLGKMAEGLEISIRWQLLLPCDLRFPRAHDRLLEDLHFRRRFPAIEGDEYGEPDLCLIPLSHRHLDDFFWQYFDPGISELCCLPEFVSREQWHAWLSGLYSDGDELPLAIIHREWGFVGCCHLVMHEGIGFLYYWMGKDFRGQGLAYRANRLLLSAAIESFGLRACYAKVFEHNLPSRRLLERLGFECLDFRTIPDETEIFYRLGEDSRHVACELRDFLARMKSDTSVAEPIYTEIKE